MKISVHRLNDNHGTPFTLVYVPVWGVKLRTGNDINRQLPGAIYKICAGDAFISAPLHTFVKALSLEPSLCQSSQAASFYRY